MDFSLSPETLEFRQTIRDIVERTVTPEVIDRMHTPKPQNPEHLDELIINHELVSLNTNEFDSSFMTSTQH